MECSIKCGGKKNVTHQMNCQLIPLLYLEFSPISRRADKLKQSCEKTADAGGSGHQTPVKCATSLLTHFAVNSTGTKSFAGIIYFQFPLLFTPVALRIFESC